MAFMDTLLGSFSDATGTKLGLVLQMEECSVHPVIYECYNQMAYLDHGEEVDGWLGLWPFCWRCRSIYQCQAH